MQNSKMKENMKEKWNIRKNQHLLIPEGEKSNERDMELKEVMAWEYFGINKRHKSLGLRLMSPCQELNEQNKTNLVTKYITVKLQNNKDTLKSDQKGTTEEPQSDWE